MISTLMTYFIFTALGLAAIAAITVAIHSFISNRRHPDYNINLIIHKNIKKLAKYEYCEAAREYIISTLAGLDIKIDYEYDDFINRITEINIRHCEYSGLYYYSRRHGGHEIETIHMEYIKIYKDINDIFDEASRITSKDDAIQATERLEQMESYHRDTYQVTKKMNA